MAKLFSTFLLLYLFLNVGFSSATSTGESSPFSDSSPAPESTTDITTSSDRFSSATSTAESSPFSDSSPAPESTTDITTASEITDSPSDSTSDSSITTEEATTISTTTSAPTTTTTAAPTTTTPPPHDLTSPFIWTGGDINPSFPYVIVRADDGYSSIRVNISDVTMADGKFMYVCGGESLKTDATDGRVFANFVKGPLSYLFRTTSVYAYTNAKSADCNFTVSFESVEQIVTTVPTTTTTEISWPTTEKQDSIYITVNVSGKNFEEYSKAATLDAFKSCVAEMAKAYCSAWNIHITKPITETNVIVAEIDRCPYQWPDSDTCVRIRFKLPIYYDSGANGYQLNSERLGIMWSRYEDGKCMSDNGFSNYEEPDFDSNITWWAVGISVVIALFIILLWFLRTYSSQFRRKEYRRQSDATSIISSKKDSIISLAPHYLQDHVDTPKFFDG